MVPRPLMRRRLARLDQEARAKASVRLIDVAVEELYAAVVGVTLLGARLGEDVDDRATESSEVYLSIEGAARHLELAVGLLCARDGNSMGTARHLSLDGG